MTDASKAFSFLKNEYLLLNLIFTDPKDGAAFSDPLLEAVNNLRWSNLPPAKYFGKLL